ncbi:helix-turn-helix transcriptional regulator [Isoptericola sp. BMS4]|uniref:helix-turn-helix transcriptional regulator n=1 Tax=Isoptericola sp. BMS4 TaxID=2527875 RepID=UPI00272A0C8F|nr:helix-turn-helix transcriptional regulator [Isoptericola sp. BMS4]
MRRSSRVPLVARQEEVATFRGALERAAAGEPGMLLVGGDAGVGKTRLVTHLGQVARDAGARVVVAHCVDLGDVGIPYLPLTEALAELRGDPDVDEAVAERPALARLLDPAADGGAEHAERLQLFDGVARSLAAAGRPGAPLVLVLEDAHWADSSTRDVLRFVVARLRAEHLLVVVTYRSDDVDRRHPLRPLLAELHRRRAVEHLELSPFTADELRDFTTAVRDGEPLPPRDLDEVRRRSEGNAFFAEELLAAGAPSSTLPWSLTDVLQARLQRLGPAAQQLARLASASGRQVDETLLAAAADRLPGLHPDGALDEALRDAVAQQVLGVEGRTLAFRHALLAEALYLDLLPGERTSIHRAYLEALAADPALGSAAQRAHHARAGHDLPAALVASAEAAVEARGLLAPAEELRHLEEVLALWESVPDAADLLDRDRVDVALEAAGAASSAGLEPRARQLAHGVVEALDDDPERQARVRHVLVKSLLVLDEDDEARRQSEAALAVLAPGGRVEEAVPTPDLAWTLALHALVETDLEFDLESDVDHDDEARRWAERAVQVARAAGAPDAEAHALTTLGVLEVEDPRAAADRYAAARERARAAGDLPTELRSWYNLTITRFYAGELEPAATTAAQGVARALETGMTWSPYGVQLQVITELLRYFQGDLAARGTAPGTPSFAVGYLDAVRLYAAVAREGGDAVPLAEATRPDWESDGQIVLLAGGCLVDALTWAQRYDDASALAEEIADHLGAIWTEFFLGRIWISALATAALADAAEAPGAGTPDGSGGAATEPGASVLARADHLLAVARETAERGRPRGGRLGPEGRAWLLRAEAERARVRAAVTGEPADPEIWERCVRAFDFGYRYETARSRLRWAQALRAAGDTPASEVEAAEALAEAEAMGAEPLADAVRSWARRARVPLPGVRRAPTTLLTAREEEVLELVAQGLSNRQIGEHLFISTKTVSVHVSNLLAKLGVSGRAEAVAVAHRRGLLSV